MLFIHFEDSNIKKIYYFKEFITVLFDTFLKIENNIFRAIYLETLELRKTLLQIFKDLQPSSSLFLLWNVTLLVEKITFFKVQQ